MKPRLPAFSVMLGTLMFLLIAQVAFLEWRDGLVSGGVLNMDNSQSLAVVSHLARPANGTPRVMFLVENNCEISNVFAERWAADPIPGVEPTWISLNAPWNLDEWDDRHPEIRPIGLTPRMSRRLRVEFLPGMIFLDDDGEVEAYLPADRTLIERAIETSPLSVQQEMYGYQTSP